jgi:hypothetical protein
MRYEIHQDEKKYGASDSLRGAIKALSILHKELKNKYITYYLDDCEKNETLFTADVDGGIKASIYTLEQMEK